MAARGSHVSHAARVSHAGRALPRLAAVAVLVLASAARDASASGPAGVEDAGAYAPRPEHDLETLIERLRLRSPGVEADLLAADVARAEARQARLLGNPVLDATWATIPIGETNPPNLGSPLARVPSYSVGIAYTFLAGKRRPRAERAEALATGIAHGADASIIARALELARILGRIAVTRLRVEGIRGLAAQQRAVIEIARARLGQGFGTPLDIDRLEIELGRSEQQVLITESEEQANLTACGTYLGVKCRGIQSAEDARAFVVAWANRASDGVAHTSQRSDVLALDSFQRAAGAEVTLARAQAIPDPSVRLGYTYDTFTVSGNQANSLSVSLTLPVPLFDHGQAQVEAAEARQKRFESQRALTLRAIVVRLSGLRELLRLQQKRQTAIEKTLPRARAVLADLERAAQSRLIPYTDVIQARRTLDELLVEEAESYGDSFQTSVDLIGELGPKGKAPR